MTLTTIYRIETPSGLGPYVDANTLLSDEQGNYECRKAHPNPWWDEKLVASLSRDNIGYRNSEHLKFAFASVDQVRDWLYKDSWIDNLIWRGYFISKKILPSYDVYEGTKQVMYNPAGVQSSNLVNIRELFLEGETA